MKWLRRRLASPDDRGQRALLRSADAARDAGRFAEAGALYDRFLTLSPERSDIRIQRGHMAKEAGDYEAAAQHYLATVADRPDDADLALQLGHFHKTIGRWAEATRWFDRALALQPGWPEPLRELAGLRDLLPADDALLDNERRTLAPALAPRPTDFAARRDHERLILHRFGRAQEGRWGVRRTLSGVEAIRGLCGSTSPLTELHVLLDGETIHREPIAAGTPFSPDQAEPRRRKYVFNAWIDFAPHAPGLRLIELRLIGQSGIARREREIVVIATAPAEADLPDCDGLIALDAADPRPVEAQIRARPSMIRAADRPRFPDGVRAILVLRTDQIGDMVASIPALRRLRALFPQARIVGLLTAANVDLARSLGLFDEAIAIDFPDDDVARRRLMDLRAQRALRDRLAPYRFDVALDLAVSDVSRDLLRLSGARFTQGIGSEWPWLDGRLRFDTPDPRTGMDTTPHSAKVLALVEALGAIAQPPEPVVRRNDLARDRLARFGIGAEERYAVLHMGARIAFTRWHGFAGLAARLLAETDLKVVLMGHDPERDPPLPAPLLADPRLLRIEGQLPFDDFDALLSFAAVLVGNDSGPKHLAALRGTPAITLFSARIDWREWGQEQGGAIISRRVPCAGCAIRHDPDECGKQVACIRDIAVEEVMGAVKRYA